MNYIRLYIKRTFTNNIKKQMFLILGIAAFVAMLVSEVMKADAIEWYLIKYAKRFDIGYSAKIPMVPLEGIAYLEGHEEITQMEAVEVVKVLEGPSGVEFLTSSHVHDTWKLDYVYGKAPGPGEVVLTDMAAIGKRQPEPGEVIRITVRVGEEDKQMDVTISGVITGTENYTSGYAFLYEEDFTKLTESLAEEERYYDAFVQNIYGDYLQGSVWHQMLEKFGTYFVSLSPEMLNVTYDVQEVISQAMRIVILFGVCLAAIIYLILQDDRKIIGVYRTLGAKKSQITVMVTLRLLCSGVIGTALGILFVLPVECVKNLLTTTNTGAIGNIGWQCLLFTSVGVFVALVLLQIPVLYYLLSETPVTLLEEEISKGENLVRLNNPKVFRVKRPLWWYSGLEGKRLKGRQLGSIIISVFAFFMVSETCLLQNVYMQEGRIGAKESTYSIRKEGESFSKEELSVLSNLPGVQIDIPEEAGKEGFFEVSVVLQDEFEIVAKTVEASVTGARLLEDKRYDGNTEEELNHDTRLTMILDVVVQVLTAVVFLFCYYVFYYLEKVEEYRRLYAMGASMTMIQKIMLFRSLRSSFIIALVNGIVSYGAFRWKAAQYDVSWLEEGINLYPVTEMLVLAVLIFGVTMGATWFASKQVMDILEKNIISKKENQM